MKIAVATQNPVKIEAVRRAFGEVLDPTGLLVEGIALSLDLPEQPIGNVIVEGATRRAHAAVAQTDADVGVGIEAGLMQLPGSDRWLSVQACVIADGNGKQSMGRGPGFELPKAILDAVLAGESLRDAFERVLNVDDPRRNGAIYFLSKGLIDRAHLTIEALRMALVHWTTHETP